MHDIDAILGKMREAIPAGPVRIKEAVEGGRKVVGCYCAYTPYEVIRTGINNIIASGKVNFISCIRKVKALPLC